MQPVVVPTNRTTTVMVMLVALVLLLCIGSVPPTLASARGLSASELLFDDEDSLELINQRELAVDTGSIEIDEQFVDTASAPPRAIIKITVEGDYDTSIEREIDRTYTLRLWPKYADGSNATTSGVLLEFEVQPLELVDLVHENPTDITHWLILFKLKGPSKKFGFSISASDIVIEHNPFIFNTARKVYPKGSYLRPELASIYATQVWRAGDTNTVVLHALDPFGTPPANFSGLDVQPANKNDTCRFGVSFDRDNGTIRLMFTQNVVGNYSYHVTILGQDVIGSPFNVTVLPAPLSSESSYVSEFCYSCWRAHLHREEVIFILLRDQYGNAVADGRTRPPNVTLQVYPPPEPDHSDFSFSLSLMLNESDPTSHGVHAIRYISNSMTPRALLVFADDTLIRSFTIETIHGTRSHARSSSAPKGGSVILTYEALASPESPNPPGQWFWWGPFPHFTPVLSPDYKALLTIMGAHSVLMDDTGRVHVDPNPPPPSSPVLQQPTEDEIQQAMELLKPPATKVEVEQEERVDEPELPGDENDPLRQLHSLQKKLAALQSKAKPPPEVSEEERNQLRQSAYNHVMQYRREILHQESQRQAQLHLTLMQHNMEAEAWTLPAVRRPCPSLTLMKAQPLNNHRTVAPRSLDALR